MATLPQWDDSVTDWDTPGVFWDVSRSVITPLAVDPLTVYVPFVPSASSNFQFQLTLDGNQYLAVVNWNLFGQRYYVNIYTLAGTLVLCIPMIGSPNFYNISLTAGYFTTMLIWRVESGNFEIL